MTRSRLVLWGGRAGDVQYASRDFWRRNLEIGCPTIEVGSTASFDVQNVVMNTRTGELMRVTSMEGGRVGVRFES